MVDHQYDAEDMNRHYDMQEFRAMRKQRDELLQAAKAALAFMHTVDWADHTSEIQSLDLRVALEVAISEAEGAPVGRPCLCRHPQTNDCIKHAVGGELRDGFFCRRDRAEGK